MNNRKSSISQREEILSLAISYLKGVNWKSYRKFMNKSDQYIDLLEEGKQEIVVEDMMQDAENNDEIEAVKEGVNRLSILIQEQELEEEQVKEISKLFVKKIQIHAMMKLTEEQNKQKQNQKSVSTISSSSDNSQKISSRTSSSEASKKNKVQYTTNPLLQQSNHFIQNGQLIEVKETTIGDKKRTTIIKYPPGYNQQLNIQNPINSDRDQKIVQSAFIQRTSILQGTQNVRTFVSPQRISKVVNESSFRSVITENILHSPKNQDIQILNNLNASSTVLIKSPTREDPQQQRIYVTNNNINIGTVNNSLNIIQPSQIKTTQPISSKLQQSIHSQLQQQNPSQFQQPLLNKNLSHVQSGSKIISNVPLSNNSAVYIGQQQNQFRTINNSKIINNPNSFVNQQPYYHNINNKVIDPQLAKSINISTNTNNSQLTYQQQQEQYKKLYEQQQLIKKQQPQTQQPYLLQSQHQPYINNQQYSNQPKTLTQDQYQLMMKQKTQSLQQVSIQPKTQINLISQKK